MASWMLSSVFSVLAHLRLVPRVPVPLENRLDAISKGASSIDNDIYDNEAFDWTQGGCGLHMLNPVRVSYFLDKLERGLSERPQRRDIVLLDLGCGAGIATEAIYSALQKHTMMTERKCTVMGVDMSARSIDIARTRAKDQGSTIQYYTGDVYNLEMIADNSVDGIICSDVLEHLLDLPRAFAEIKRVLIPGAVFTFDTINRTPISYYLTIWILQDLLKAMQGDAHDHKLYVTPEEARTLMQQSGLRPGPAADLIGMRPGIQFPPVALYRWFTGYSLIAAFLANFKKTSDTSISYLHWCTKP